MNIRPYQESDAESVSALWDEVFPNNPSHSSPKLVISQKLAVQPELFFITEINSVIIGTIMAGYDGHRGWLYTVAVSPQYQRQGIGSKLVQHAEKVLIAMGCLKINLQVRVSNAEVVEFYRKLGYLVEERISMGKLVG
ncbi:MULTISPECIES: GNAT family acetyltransferase [unclassified Nostoc]|uniref:GNAT family acetyltransferase n=1 Tax=unclassified Nostoc TaxID=2593658 RepID=UPI0026189AA5|nr:GNAT family acetyltransferase [Nostoc sp. S13]MDF5734524.1 GNAT family acetyltransferase [Nostoc sp. S13]